MDYIVIGIFLVVILAVYFDGKIALRNKDIELSKLQKEIEEIKAKSH